ncbi:hypothetical protein [Pseudomonas putida]|uniref:hypothetical protein n=1 Tax=Pseudomonas putida TaxID=303 RepID=UPI003132FC1A
MATLKEIMQRGDSDESRASASTEISNAHGRVAAKVSTIIGGGAALAASSLSFGMGSIFGSKATAQEKFSQSVAALVTSSEFIDELSAMVGEPADGESKSDFIARSQAAMKDLIKSKLS